MLVYLKPLSIFPELHSDTLFGAITYAISQLYPEKVEEMIEDFNKEPPFLLSSTFPYAYKDDAEFADCTKIRFYPKIISKQSTDKKHDPQYFKDFKKVEYVCEDIFFKMIKGDLSSSDILENYKDYYKVKTLLLDTKIDIDVTFGENIIPNNSVNRITNETEGIFYTSGKEYKNIGLFFLVEFNNDEYIPIVKSALRFLRDRGFGRDISNGKGQFDYIIEEDYSLNDIVDNSSFNYFITLSRFIPSDEDLTKINEFSSYEIDSKRGKSSAGEIRKQIRFFKEGSIFPDYQKYYGRLVQSGKDSPAVEYGFAFPLKCIGNEEVQ